MSENADKDSGVSPSWEVLRIVAGYMNGKTLATASCVSKTWSLCFSSDHLYRSLISTHHPSISSAAATSKTSPAISCQRLYSAAESAANRRRHVRQPPKPKISMSDLTFIVQVRNSAMNLTIVKQGKDIAVPSDGLFRFNIDVDHNECSSVSLVKEAKVTWQVVFREWKSVFTMTDSVRSLEKEKWFSEELPPPEYSVFNGGSGLAADVNLEITLKQQAVKVEKLCLGIMNTVDLRYLNLDDGLRYLQRFLLTKGI